MRGRKREGERDETTLALSVTTNIADQSITQKREGEKKRKERKRKGKGRKGKDKIETEKEGRTECHVRAM